MPRVSVLPVALVPDQVVRSCGGVLVADGSTAGTAPPDVRRAYQQMMRGQVAAGLRALGFTGTYRVFRIRRGGHYGEVRWQKDARQIRRLRLRFTVNVGYRWGGSRIAMLMPEPQTDIWWELADGQPAGPVGDSVIAAVRRYALPAILAGLDDLDRQQDPAVRWARTFPPVPESLRLPDGGAADRTAWYVRAAGTEADPSFADLASDIARVRLGAAQDVAGYALGDPRAVPALLDRLEHDPSPVIRKMVASRMLTPVAYDTRVRAALQAAADADHDPGVRWAARYALRVDLRTEGERQLLPGPDSPRVAALVIRVPPREAPAAASTTR